MNNLVIALLLIAGLVSGYFIGDYRGASTRKALAEAVETGKILNEELQKSNDSLKADLDQINGKHEQELKALRDKYAADSAAWERTRASLAETIKNQNGRLSQLNSSLDAMLGKLGASSGAEKQKIEANIATLRKEIERLNRDLNGNVCLQQQAPASVIEALNSAGIDTGSGK